MRKGITLIEVLIAIAVLAILLGLLVPAVARVRETANKMACANNLRQLALASHAHSNANGHLPAYATTRPHGSWWIALLPYVEDENLYQEIMSHSATKKVGTGHIGGLGVFHPGIRDAPFPLLQCPSDSSGYQPPVKPGAPPWTMTNYLANWYVFGDGVEGCFNLPQKLEDVSDGLSSTVLFAEGYAQCQQVPRRACLSCDLHNFGITMQGLPSDDPVYLPVDYTMFQVRPLFNECDGQRSQTPHAAMNVAMADGSARSIAPEITPATWKLLLKPNDGVPVSGDW